VIIPVIDAQDVEQLLHLLGCGRHHSFALGFCERLVKRLVAQTRKVQITSVEVHHAPVQLFCD
jgi:hypothetical protein